LMSGESVIIVMCPRRVPVWGPAPALPFRFEIAHRPDYEAAPSWRLQVRVRVSESETRPAEPHLGRLASATRTSVR
jgi:hypothetical protein